MTTVETSDSRLGGQIDNCPGFAGGGRYVGSYSQADMWHMPRAVPLSVSPEQLHRTVPVRWSRSRTAVEGPLDIERLRASITETFAAHDILHSVVRHGAFRPEVEVLPDWLPEVSVEDGCEGAAEHFFSRPLDPVQGPPSRVAIFRQGAEKYEVCIHQHHLFSDGIALDVVRNEVLARYFGQAPVTSAPSFRDYCETLEQWLGSEQSQDSRAYWRQKLQGASPAALPLDRPRTEPCDFRGESIDIAVSAEVFSALRKVCRKVGTTVFAALAWALARALYEEMGQEDVLLSTFHGNRSLPGFQKVVGPLLSGLFLRCHINRAKTPVEQLLDAHRVVKEALDHGAVPPMYFAEQADMRLPARNVNLVYQSFVPADAIQVGPLKLRQVDPIGFASGHAAFELELVFWRQGHGLSGVAAFSTQVFHRGTVDRILGRYYRALSELVA